MNQQIKQQWLEALRSKEFTQGTAYLRYSTPEGTVCHCVQGVLMELAQQAGAIRTLGEQTDFLPGTSDTHQTCQVTVYEGLYESEAANGTLGQQITSIIPENVRIWAGLQDEHPSAHYQRELQNIMRRNDSGTGFAELASYIEATF